MRVRAPHAVREHCRCFLGWRSALGREDRVAGAQDTGEWIVSVTPMIFNDRVLLTHKERDYPYGCTAGWCYDKGGAAVLAALAWNVDTEDEPAGFKKCAFDSRY